MAFAWDLTKETIKLPLGCLKGGHPERDLARVRFQAIPSRVQLQGSVLAAQCRRTRVQPARRASRARRPPCSRTLIVWERVDLAGRVDGVEHLIPASKELIQQMRVL